MPRLRGLRGVNLESVNCSGHLFLSSGFAKIEGFTPESGNWSTEYSKLVPCLARDVWSLGIRYAVIGCVLGTRFLERAILPSGVVDVASSEFADSGSFSSNETSFVEELFVHLFNRKVFWTENDEVHVGIDVDMLITCWFGCALKEPNSSIDVCFPYVVFSDRFQASDHFVSGAFDGGCQGILVDSSFAEPSPGNHPYVVMNLDIELVN